jgi:hypothetical protein
MQLKIKKIHAVLLLVAPLILGGAGTAAAAQRTFVATSGVDNPSCSLASPCRTFAAAVAATAIGGEAIVLDSGGYGPVTVTKSMSIITPPGIYAGVSVPAGSTELRSMRRDRRSSCAAFRSTVRAAASA